nr:hypothetical protein BCU28_10260 [Vibrio cyclitrophicus]
MPFQKMFFLLGKWLVLFCIQDMYKQISLASFLGSSVSFLWDFTFIANMNQVELRAELNINLVV